MPQLSFTMQTPIVRTARVAQVESLFDVPAAERSALSWDVSLPLEEREWSVGLIVGPSGSGKSSIARALFGDAVRTGFTDWPADLSVVDAIGPRHGVKEITSALMGVGFGSPPNWLRPYAVLSTGEQFRVTCARALLESDGLVVLDEFTSVVDRQVAQIASHSIQKSVRKSGKKLIAVTCHYDVLEWLQPDWVYQPHTNTFNWRLLRRHPDLEFLIYPGDRASWKLFSQYHYLSASLHSTAQCFLGFIGDECVAFNSYVHLPHPRTRNIKQGTRLVVRPDYQGLGLGGRFDDWLGQYLYERGYRYHNTIAHPGMIAYYSRSPRWKMLGVGSSGPSPPGAGAESLIHAARATSDPLHVRGLHPTDPRSAPSRKQPDGRRHTLDNTTKGRLGNMTAHDTAKRLAFSQASSLRSSPKADPSMKKNQAQFRRLNTVTFEYAPPVGSKIGGGA